MTIEQTVELEAPAEKVYAAWTEEAEMQGWWCKNPKLGQKPGEIVDLNFVKEGQPVNMKYRIEALEPETHVRWTCIENDMSPWVGTTLDIRITSKGESSSMTLEHSGWDTDKYGSEIVDNVRGGWGHFLQSLSNYCSSGVGAAM